MVATKNSKAKVLITLLFLALSSWWVYLIASGYTHGGSKPQLFAASYGIMALVGGLVGLAASKKWGGAKSILGKSLLLFSLGLFAQEFGQLTYSYYIYFLKEAVPYPSIGDIGFFGSVILYIWAAILLAKTAGVGVALKSKSRILFALFLPAAMLAISYTVFLRGYQFSFSSLNSTLKVLLDFGYPLGQATYVAIAFLTYLLSKKLLGGVMKKKILILLFALVVQYIADFTFLYQNIHEKWVVGGWNDYLYLVAYFIMAIALNGFRTVNSAPPEKAPEVESKTAEAKS